MSMELHQLMQERARIGVMRWPAGLALSLGVHVLVLGGSLYLPKSTEANADTKVTWVTLPAAAGSGVSGGSAVTEEGEQGERQRRVEEVAP